MTDTKRLIGMKYCIALLILALTHRHCVLNAQPANTVRVVGEMRNVMWKGELSGNIYLDTIAKKKDLYGLGPLENLAGEIVIVDGKAYKSTVVSGTSMKVEETYDIRAPFFGYANIPKWTYRSLPDTVRTIGDLERYLDATTKDHARPFMFRLIGTVEKAKIHIVNLPEGSTVRSPAEAHEGQVTYHLANAQSEIIGFFSTQHKSIFTHHDTFIHMHLITTDRQSMGHLDEMLIKKGTMNLWLPAQ